MNVKIEPRTTMDRGGYLMMPLRVNVQNFIMICLQGGINSKKIHIHK